MSDRFVVYRRMAEKGEEGYSTKDYRAPHYEGPHTPEGMSEWVNYYEFEKDGKEYIASLDEAWWWGGGHNDGGCIHTSIPKEWFKLDYDDFLDHVLSLSSARHYGFTIEDLKEKKGLKKFFGYEKK